MKNKLLLPRLLIVVAALCAIAAFFLPYISATEDYREYMASRMDEKPLEGVDITGREMMDMSLFKYARVYFQGGEAIFHSHEQGVLYGAIISAIAGFALLTLLAGLGMKPVLTLILDLLMGVMFYLVNWDFVDRGIMPDGDRVWGIAHLLYYPIAAVIAVCAVWMFVEKRNNKRRLRP